jgi:putative restriction endonuclease
MRKWTHDELLVAFNFYCRIPFGQLHHTNPTIGALARTLDRTPASVSMKLCNFASFDPAHQARNVAGLKHAGKLDKEVWDAFNSNWEKLAYESEQALVRLGIEPTSEIRDEEREIGTRETETTRVQRVRLVQRFFRQSVLSSYQNRCAMCDLSLPGLLVASHIIPWRTSVERRADPRNGLALCGLHDLAFDRGYVGVDTDCRIIVSRAARTQSPPPLHTLALLKVEGQRLTLPHRFQPDPEALAYHREAIFMQ